MKKTTENIENENKKNIKTILIRFLIILLLILVGIYYYATNISVHQLKINEVLITSENIPESFNGIKIIQISDIHYNTTYKKKELNNLVEEINKQNPDLVVFTGDLLDSSITYKNTDLEELTNILSTIETKLGKYAIKGEEDFLFTEWETIMKNSGFIDLSDKHELIYNESLIPILLTGLSSNINSDISPETKLANTDAYLNTVKDKSGPNIPTYNILLMHEADYINKINYNNYDLVMAGHSHGGYININGINNLLVKDGSNNYIEGKYTLDNTLIYVSNGLGTSKYNFRLFNTPSINLYRLDIKK